MDSSNCGISCDSAELDCYVLDNNGHVIVSELLKDTGRFFGEVNGYVMDLMVRDSIFNRIHIYDYQAVCFRGGATVSQGSFLLTVSGNNVLSVKPTLKRLFFAAGQNKFHTASSR